MKTVTGNALVLALMERQAREGWSDRRMAQEIGITRANWSFLRAGRHQPSMRTVKKAVGRFPEYTSLALFFLLPDVANSDIRVTGSNIAD